jgi:hypothetical protein
MDYLSKQGLAQMITHGKTGISPTMAISRELAISNQSKKKKISRV